MSNVVKFPDIDKIEEEAAAWVACLDSGNISENEVEALRAWLAVDPLHGSTLLEMAELMDHMSVLSKLANLFPLNELVLPVQTQSSVGGWLSSTWRPLAGIATMLLVALMLLRGTFYEDLSQSVAREVVSTEVGGMKETILTDGSKVTLNTQSSVRIEFTPHERRVILDYGEALFEVAHEKNRPFYVLADGNLVRAVGTAFNVEIGSEGVEVVVTEGVVEIAPAYETSSLALSNDKVDGVRPPNVGAIKPVRVAAGQLALINHTLDEVHPVDTRLVEAKLAWQRGELVFQREALHQVVTEVSRYTNQSLIIADDRIRDIKIGGRFPAGDIENLLDILYHGFDVEANRTDQGVIYLVSRD